MKKSHLLILLSLMLSGFSVLAAETSLPTVMNTLQSTSVAVNSQLTTMALRTLGAALLLQWILTNWKELFSGEITSLFQKIAGLVTWAGICFWAMGNQDILSTMFTGYLNMASNVTGIKFTPENVWANGVDLQNNMVIAFNNRTGAADSLYSSLKNLLPSLLLMLACLLILVSYGVIAISILVAVSEFWLMFTVTPIAIALLGLQAFRDQGMAPLKGVISLGMRLIILGVIVKILASVQAEVVNAFENMPQVNPLEIVWYALGGVFACAVMAFNAGKIASAIASGSSNFSGSDAIRGGLQMVSTAAAVGTMGATAASAAMSASSNPAGMGNGPIGGGMQSLLGGASGSGGGGNLG
ncbi:type IV secretion system protein, partial [Glaciimonas sp. GG7]